MLELISCDTIKVTSTPVKALAARIRNTDANYEKMVECTASCRRIFCLCLILLETSLIVERNCRMGLETDRVYGIAEDQGVPVDRQGLYDAVQSQTTESGKTTHDVDAELAAATSK